MKKCIGLYYYRIDEVESVIVRYNVGVIFINPLGISLESVYLRTFSILYNAQSFEFIYS